MKPVFFSFILVFITLFTNAQSRQDSLSIYFETDRYQITEENKALLKSLSQQIDEIKILGYTDTVGTSLYNRALSNKRAYSTYFYLLNNGFEIPQIKEVRGQGEEPFYKSNSLDSSRKTVIYYQSKAIPNLVEPKKTEQTESGKRLEEQINTTAVGKNLIIKNINFYPGSHQHLPQSEADMKALLEIMKTNSNLKIQIQGHICCEEMGLDGYDKLTGDQYLSVNRAKHIYDYLINNGISEGRLSYKGLGSSMKLYPFERSEMEKIANRRVEIKILSK